MPNAAAQARQTAGARHERTLCAVACSRLFGLGSRVLGACPRCALRAYWITSSARRSRDGGIVIPSALAVLRLIISSYFVGSSTGKSAGLAPFRRRSTKYPKRRYQSGRLGQ